ncbi:RNA polymerase I-specific transcription initiation factor RRN3 isoform X2 [Manihot esculenta]|uniref:RNA polymerase I-specific transcription initiation factor RRN3 isoform X2 n=1 Tax=Manihot esculenta TaxID=3983 RepID=UPI000B5D4D4B|nr:RNA polymerase I-specific transcription initiation factor RRN3 isoform X2 [Manihot esculenta]
MGVEMAYQYNGEFQEMEDVNFSDSELVCHVRDALISVQTGDSDSYHQLVGVMHHSERLAPDEVALLVTSLKALSGAVSYIDNVHHDSLLNSIFGMSLWKYGPDVMDALLELIIALAASNGKYVDSCLDMLVSNFMPPMYLVYTLKQPRGQAKKEQVLSRVHTALEDIVDLIPMAASRLSSVVVHRMPTTFKKDLEKDHLMYRTEIYVENILRLESGAIREFVGSRMLMAVVDLLTELDVAIGWDDILRDDSCKGIFAIELEDADEVDDDENDYGEVFETLLDSFMLTILNTYKSKFAQFVMFYACALDPEKCGVKFAKTLADRFSCSDNPVTRMSAVAYLASYLARAKFLSPAFVASTLKRLVDWCLEYCETQGSDMNPKAHRVFYSGCQAIMYVLCFRMKSLMDVPRFKSQLLLMPLEPVLKHKLDPLKVCLPSIVEEFLKQAKAAYLFTTSETFIFEDMLESDFSKDFGGLERLDMFFPFDPCLLKKSDRGYIRPNFVYWKHVRTTYGSDEDDSSDADIAEDFVAENGESSMEEGRTGSLDEQYLELDEFDHAMNKMSITPKNGFTYRFGGEQMKMPSRIRPSTTPESL